MAATLAAPTARGAKAKPGSKASRAPAPAPSSQNTMAEGAGHAPLQAKLEVGPAHDRFEAEADRVADTVVGPSSAAAAPPPISALAGNTQVGRKPLQREESRPINQREEQDTTVSTDLTDMLQRKTVEGEGKLDDELVQAKPEGGVLQRDDVSEDTVEETTVQTKRDFAQRETVKATSELETEEPKQDKPIQPPAQRDGGGAGFTAPASTEAGIAAMRGRGEPLAPSVRDYMEPRFGRDLSGVRIHSGTRAADLSRSVSARAFTVGQDVFFGAGQYRPETTAGRRLLAHELTHTVQQKGHSGHAQTMRIQRDRTNNAENASGTSGNQGGAGEGDGDGPSPIFEHDLGTLRKDENNNHTIDMTALPLPKLYSQWKGVGGVAHGSNPTIPETAPSSWAYKGKTPRGSTTARQQWLTELVKSKAAVQTKIESMMPPGEQSSTVYLRSNNTSGAGLNFLLIGTPSVLSEMAEILIPIWNKEGSGALYDVDHIQELQLGGKDGFENFWLLDQGSNRSSGSNIARIMKNEFNQLINAAEADGYFVAERGGTLKPEWSSLKSSETNAGYHWQLSYSGFREISISGTDAFWTKAEISTGEHLDQLQPLTAAEIMERGLDYSRPPNEKVANFFALRSGGGFFRRVNYSNPANVVAIDQIPGGDAGQRSGVDGNQFYKGLAVGSNGITMVTTGGEAEGEEAVSILGGPTLSENAVIANIRGQPFPASGKITADAIDIPVKWKRELGFGGYVDKGWINERLARLSIEGLSPVILHEAGLTPNGELFANGEISATKALFPNLTIPIQLQGNEILISFPVPTDRLDFGMVRVTDAAINVGFGEHGVFLGGFADIVVDSVGTGRVEARVDGENGVVLDGDFNFDFDFLDPANAHITYRMADDSLTLTLRAGVREGVLPGVTSGLVTGTFSRETIDLTGTLNLAAPLDGASITLGYTEATGVTIAANDVPLPFDRIPGVDSATLSAEANYDPEAESWHLSGTGIANFSLPPATGTLQVALDGNAVTITGDANFRRGIASGTVSVTATNQAVDDAGEPIEGQINNNFTIWGRGSASIQFGILTGTAGIELTRDEEIIITGEIALPPTHPVFDRRSYDRELFHVEPPEIPIWGVSLLGVGFGIFAFFDARLSFDAFVGPGTLENTSVTVQFNLDQPEDAVVDGNAEFVVPAGAGFTLDIGGGLRARAAVAFAQGRVGLDARLGIEAEARAEAGLHWSREEGLSLNARASAEASPVFDVGANASVTAGVDLGIFGELTKTWGPWRRQLGSFGPEMAVGVAMPIAWSEQDGLDFDMADIEVTQPDVNPGEMIADGFMEVSGLRSA